MSSVGSAPLPSPDVLEELYRSDAADASTTLERYPELVTHDTTQNRYTSRRTLADAADRALGKNVAVKAGTERHHAQLTRITLLVHLGQERPLRVHQHLCWNGRVLRTIRRGQPKQVEHRAGDWLGLGLRVADVGCAGLKDGLVEQPLGLG